MMTKVGVKPSKYTFALMYTHMHTYVRTITNLVQTCACRHTDSSKQHARIPTYVSDITHACTHSILRTYIRTYIHMHTVPVGWKVYPVRGCSAHAVCLLPSFPTLHQLSSGKQRVFCQQTQWPVSGRHAHRGVTQLGLHNTKTAFHQTQTHGLPHQQPLQIAKDKYKTGNNLFTELS